MSYNESSGRESLTNFRVTVEGRKPFELNLPEEVAAQIRTPTYDYVSYTKDIEAENRGQAAQKAIAECEEAADDERYEYRVQRTMRAKPRESQNYRTPAEVWE